ncbi:MAG: hypothetical protein KDJ44_10925 [Rhodoblastus sp.]|nr:hypothetical protein [Rhodoblastus sp.]
MSALGPHSLNEACRTIYVRAADNFVLPPLIQDAAEPEPPHRRIEISGDGFCVLFRVYYESAGAAPGPLERPPLRFEIEACADADGQAVTLSERDRLEMIRAFLLGVRDPVAVDAPADGADLRVGLRLNGRMTLWSPQTAPLSEGLSTMAVCEQLAARLLEGTRSLFGSRAEGLEVWEVRLREELFGEPPLSADDIWPTPRQIDTPAALQPAANASPRYAIVRPREANPLPLSAARTRPARRRSALAAAMALVGLAALAGAIASHEPGPAIRAQDADRVSERDHAPSIAPVNHIAEAPPAAFRVASLGDRAALSPEPRDPRLALLAPTVFEATRALAPSAPTSATSHASGHTTKVAAVETPALAAPHPAPPRRPAAHVKRAPQRHAKTSPLARVDRAVKKFVRSVAARLPRAKFSAMNSPHAAGPR